MPGTPEQALTEDSTLQEEANLMSQWILHAKNAKEKKSTITFAGMICFPNGKPMESGSVIAVKGKGIFDGNWIIVMVRFALIEGRMVTELSLEKCIPPELQRPGELGQENLDEDKKPEETKPKEPVPKVDDQTPAGWAKSQLSPEESRLMDDYNAGKVTGGPEVDAMLKHYNDLMSQFIREHM